MPSFNNTSTYPRDRARLSLEGLSVGDAIGECFFTYLTNYQAALWATVSGYGDIDTNCAIVGGIVALAVGWEGIPTEWRARREPLPAWASEEEHGNTAS